MALAIVSLLYSWVFFSCLPEECHWNKEQVQYLSSSLYPTYFLRAVFLIPPEPDFVNKHQFFFSMVQVSGELCLYHLTAAVQGQGSGWEYKGVVPGAEESSRKALLHCDRQQETGAWEQRSFKMWTYFPWFLCLSFHSKPTSTSSQNPPPFPFPPVCWHSLLAAGCPDFTLLLLFSCKQMFFRWWHLSEFGRRCAGRQEGSVLCHGPGQSCSCRRVTKPSRWHSLSSPGTCAPRGWDTGALSLVTSSDTSSPGPGVDRWGTAVLFAAVGLHIQQGSLVGQSDLSKGSFPCPGQLCIALGNSAAHPTNVPVLWLQWIWPSVSPFLSCWGAAECMAGKSLGVWGSKLRV